MQATIEISMYPLTEDYAQVVTDFILTVRKHAGIKVETNGLSTQLFGDYDLLMDVLRDELKAVFEERKAVFVLKMAGGELTRENLPASLR